MASLLRYARSPIWSVRAFKRALPAMSYSSDLSKMPTDEEQATGLEKKELDALMAGIEDPFRMRVEKRIGGTKDKPQMVPSMYPERIVGCICDEETATILWMKVKQGPAQRCDCGHWFQLTKGRSVDVDM